MSLSLSLDVDLDLFHGKRRRRRSPISIAGGNPVVVQEESLNWELLPQPREGDREIPLYRRFPCLRSLTLKGKPLFADFNLVPHEWGGFLHPWIEALAKARVGLEELRLKRMVVSDESHELLSRSFVSFKSLVLVSCDGFTTDGLASIAANCRHLRELDLQENEIDDHRGQCLNCFPDTCTMLISLNFAESTNSCQRHPMFRC